MPDLPEKSAVSATTVVKVLSASSAFSCFDLLAAGAMTKKKLKNLNFGMIFFISRDFFKTCGSRYRILL